MHNRKWLTDCICGHLGMMQYLFLRAEARGLIQIFGATIDHVGGQYNDSAT